MSSIAEALSQIEYYHREPYKNLLIVVRTYAQLFLRDWKGSWVYVGGRGRSQIAGAAMRERRGQQGPRRIWLRRGVNSYFVRWQKIKLNWLWGGI